MTRNRLGLVYAGFAALAACALMASPLGPQGTPESMAVASFDYREYSTVKALGGDSDLVVEVTIGPILSTGLDYGSEVADRSEIDSDQAVPVAITEVAIKEVLSGSINDTSTIGVLTTDHSELTAEGSPMLSEGETVILFLTATTDPLGTGRDQVFAVTGGDQGVFDVKGDRATSRSLSVRGISGPVDPDASQEDDIEYVTMERSLIFEALRQP